MVAEPPLEEAKQPLYYGWVMLLLAMGLAIASSPGQTFGVSIFIEPMRLELGLTHGQMGLAYTLGTLFGAGPILWIGHQVDRRGLRRVALAVVVAFGLSCCLMGLVQNWIQVVFAFTLLRMLGPGALSLISSNVLPFWFSRRLGTVEGLRQTAMAIAMATVPPLNLWLVYQFGWRIGYAALGVSILFVVGFAVWRWFRSFPEEFGLGLDGVKIHSEHEGRLSLHESEDCRTHVRGAKGDHNFTISETIKTTPFWIVLAGTSLFGLIQTGVFFCLTPILAEFQLHEGMAATMLAAFAISLAIHQVIGGRLADQLEAKWLLALGMCLFASGLGCITLFHGSAEVLIAGCLLGAAQGIYFSAAQPLWARYYGTKHLGKLRGVLMATMVATSSIGPFLVGACFDIYSSFLPVLGLFAMLPIAFAVVSLSVKAPKLPNDSLTPQ
ncbi:MFS transporter [Pirellulaceae bacterium SH501]